ANYYHNSVPINGDNALNTARWEIGNFNASAEENAVWEELLNTPTISTVKSFQLANERSIPIFVLSSANAASLLPQLTIDAGTLAEIKDELAGGATVTVPRDPTPLDGWNGAGYLAVETSGTERYMITGKEHADAAQGGQISPD